MRWGIAGPGAIAVGFADDLALVEDAQLVAVGSRSAERAVAFADRYDVRNRHGSYEELAGDPEVDIVYVATPQSRHEADVLLFLEAGKHVLCEKPFALNQAQARRMVDTARARGLFLMEAMWTRFLPSYRMLVDVINEGSIGDVLLVEADFGFRREMDPAHRLFDLALGGGGLLDLGIYPVQLDSLLLGTPDRVAAEGHVGETGVDESVAAVLHHDGGRLGVVMASLRVNMTFTARISGTDGVIDVPALMHCPQHLEVHNRDGTQRLDAPWEGNGLRFQVAEVHRCIADGRQESTVMSLDETVSIATTLDAIRAQIGVVYPGEEVLAR